MQASAHTQGAASQRSSARRAQTRSASSRPPRKAQQFRPFSGSNERANVIPKAAAAEVTGKVVDVELLDAATQSYAVVVDLGNGKQGVGTVSSAIKLGDSVTAIAGEGVGGLAALSIVDTGITAAGFESDGEAALAGFSKLQAELDASQQAWAGLPVTEAAHEEVVDELVRHIDTVPEGSSLQVGDQLQGTVVAVSPSGVVVDLGEGVRGLARVGDLKVPAAKVSALGLSPAAIELHALLAAAKAGDEAGAQAAAAKLLARKAEIEAAGAALDAEAEKLLGSLGTAGLDADANASIAAVLTPEAYKQVTEALAASEGISSEDAAAVKAGLAALGSDGPAAADDSDVSAPTDEFDEPEYSLTYGTGLEGYEALPVTDASAVYAVGDSIPVFVKDLQFGYAFLTQYTAEEEKASALATVAEFADQEGDDEVADAALSAALAGNVLGRVAPSADALAAAQYAALDKALAAALSAEQKARLDSIRDKVMLDGALTPSDDAFLASLSPVLSSNEAVLDIVGRNDVAVDASVAEADEEGLLADLTAAAGEEAAESIKALLNELSSVEEVEGVDAAEVARVMGLSGEALQQEVARLLEGQDLPEEGSLDLLSDVKAMEKLAGMSSLAAEFQSVLGGEADNVTLEALADDAIEGEGDEDETAALLAELSEEDLGEEGASEEDIQEVTAGMARMEADESNADKPLSEWDLGLASAAADDTEDDSLEREIIADVAADMDDDSAAALAALNNYMTAAEQSTDSATPAAPVAVGAIVTEPFEIPAADAAAPAPAKAAPAAKAAAPKAEPAPSSAPAKKPAAAAGPSAKLVKELRDKTGAGMMDCKKALAESGNDLDKATEYLRNKGLLSAGKKAGRTAAEGLIQMYVHPDARFGILMEVNCETDFVAGNKKFYELVSELCTQLLPDPTIRFVSVEDVPEEVLAKEREIESGKEDLAGKPEAVKAKMVEGRVQKNLKEQSLLEQKFWKDDSKTVAEVIKEAIAGLGENIKVRRFQRITLGEGIQKKEANLADEVAAATQVAPKAPKAEAPKEEKPKEEAAPKATVQVSAKAVKELRDQTGAGMMDCKKALAENNGDPVLATEWLRKKGLAGAAKKAGRTAAEGLIVGYLHPDCRFGVLVEANCETDFVAGSEKFYQFAQSIAVSIASNKDIQYVSVEDIPADVLAAERAAALTAPDLEGKPEEIKAKIVEGRVAKAAEGMALMNQPYVYDQDKTVAEVVKEAISQLGENIKIRRFLRYDLGSGIERKEANLAAEVAAMTGSS